MQVHDGTPPMSRQSEFGPHGDGIHGFIANSGFGSGAKILSLNWIYCLHSCDLRGIAKQRVKGSPVKPGLQEHIGL